MVWFQDPEAERPPLSIILPRFYLGAERDVTQDRLAALGISYVLSVSRCSPQPSFLPGSRFLRIPIDDSLRAELLPWIPQALSFIDAAMSSGASVLVHCAAGISRSPALAVAYVMYRLEMDLDHAYRFVKERRPTISPNFNFLGQLQLFQGTLNQKGPGGDSMARQQENQGPSTDETVSRSLCSQNQNYLSQSVSADPSQPSCSLLHDSGKQQGPQTLDQNQQCSRGPHEAQSTCLQFPSGTASLLERRKSLSLSLRPLGTCTPPPASSSPQSAGAPQPEEVLRGPCHSQRPVKVRGPLSPFSLSLNKLLEWGERLLLGGLFVPPVRMGQPSLSYRY